MFSNSLNFNGNCREAVTFYAQVFEQPAPFFLTYGEGSTSFDPNVQMSEAGKNQIMFSSLNIAGTVVEFCDMPDNFEFIAGNNFSLMLTYDTVAEARKTFDRLSQNGQVFVPLAEIPGQGYYSMLGDQFGTSWIIKAK